MRLTLQNTIKLDKEVEIIHEEHEVEVVTKGAFLYLVYTNDEKEKVVIKANSEELLMTRFSRPKSLMRFKTGEETKAMIPTPVGLQELGVRTTAYTFDASKKQIVLVYDLFMPHDREALLASYELKLAW